MNNIFIYFLFGSILFSNSIFLGLDISHDIVYEIDDYDVSLSDPGPDDKAVVFGYNHALSNTLDISFSYMINPLGWDLECEELSCNDGDKIGFVSVYLKPKFDLSKNIDLWLDIGINKPLEDLEDLDLGLMYGAGFNFNLKNQLGISLGYHLNQTSEYMSFGDNQRKIDYKFGRTTLYLTYKLDYIKK